MKIKIMAQVFVRIEISSSKESRETRHSPAKRLGLNLDPDSKSLVKAFKRR